MDQIKQIDQKAYEWLIERNPNSWLKAFLEMDRRCSTFENGISRSFNRAIMGPRHKPIITMLEEIRLYIMQRLVAMNKLAFSLEDNITPSIRKRLGLLKEKQGKGDHSYGVNLQHKVCQCRMWELSGVLCVHVVAAYMHVGTDLDVGVSFWYSQESWFNAYQLSIKPVFGSNMWKRTNGVPPLPPLIRKMHGRPQEARIKAPCETSGSHVSRLGVVAVLVEVMEMMAVVVEWVAEVMPVVVKYKAVVVVAEVVKQVAGVVKEVEWVVEWLAKVAGEVAGVVEEVEEVVEWLDKERREEQELQAKQDYFNPANWTDESIDEVPYNQQYHEIFILSIHSQPIQQSGIWVKDTIVITADIEEAPVVETSDTTEVGKGKASTIVQNESAPAVDKGKAVE
ncbi:zinc finger, PMZ-type containing protein [Tanacetum coccineum]